MLELQYCKISLQNLPSSKKIINTLKFIVLILFVLPKNPRMDYDITNVLEKIKLKQMFGKDIDYNYCPEIISHYHDEIVKSKKDRMFKKGHKQELFVVIHHILLNMKNLNYGDSKSVNYLLKKTKDNRNFDEEDFNYLLKNSKLFIADYNKRIEKIKELISNEYGNEKILNILKSNIESGAFLSSIKERYLLFCSLDFEKMKIHGSGIVPIGWLPSDLQDIYKTLGKNIEELSKSQRSSNLTNAGMHFLNR